MFLPVLLASVLAATQPAMAPASQDTRWVYVSGSEDGTRHYDQRTIRRTGTSVTLFYKLTNTELDEGIRSSVMQVQISCTERTIRYIHASHYDDNGRILFSDTATGENARSIFAMPGDHHEGLVDAVC